MPAARRVAVRQLIHQGELRAARQQRVEVHLLQSAAAVFDLAARHDLEAFEQRLGFPAPVGLHDADDDINAFLEARACGGEHLVGLAHTGRGAEEELQPTTRTLLRGRQ